MVVVKGVERAGSSVHPNAASQWRVVHDIQLPTDWPFSLQIAACTDADAPTTVVPGCCVLTSGFMQLPRDDVEHMTAASCARLVGRVLLSS